jgi:Transglycosylase SLT domain/SPOR domain
MRLFAIAMLALGLSHAQGPAASASGLSKPLVQFSKRALASAAVSSQAVAMTLHWRMAQNGGNDDKTSAVGEPSRIPSATRPRKVDILCQKLTVAAKTNGLPLDFFTRLIWHESRFRSYAISPAGAQGVAQFMPGTANDVGLADPFDVATAITKSAELLRRLKEQFGNWGLAAAAYNAGPKRVDQWIASRRALPLETRAYVLIVTGRTVENWTASDPSALVAVAADTLSCQELVSLLPQESYPSLPMERSVLAGAPPSRGPAWGVQLLGGTSQAAVLAAYRHLQTQFRLVLGKRQPMVIRSPIGRLGSWYRVRIAANSLSEAEKLCASLRALGGDCLAQRN